jgi:hypothetical protein
MSDYELDENPNRKRKAAKKKSEHSKTQKNSKVIEVEPVVQPNPPIVDYIIKLEDQVEEMKAKMLAQKRKFKEIIKRMTQYFDQKGVLVSDLSEYLQNIYPTVENYETEKAIQEAIKSRTPEELLERGDYNVEAINGDVNGDTTPEKKKRGRKPKNGSTTTPKDNKSNLDDVSMTTSGKKNRKQKKIEEEEVSNVNYHHSTNGKVDLKINTNVEPTTGNANRTPQNSSKKTPTWQQREEEGGSALHT